MLVVEPEKRFTIVQIEKHKWLADAPPVDTGPDLEMQQLNLTVIEHMLQLPGLTQNMILQSLKGNSFDHIYAIYNLLVDKLHQRTIKFQSKISQPTPTSTDTAMVEDDPDSVRAPKINERSESFNEQLVTNLIGEVNSKSSEVKNCYFV